MKVFNIEGIEMIHIQEFAQVAGRSVQSTRHLIEKGGTIRKLKAIRMRSQLMIPITELKGYPFVKQGSAMGSVTIYHYVQMDKIGCDGEPMWEAKICPICTYSDGKCEMRKVADDLFVPEGDK